MLKLPILLTWLSMSEEEPGSLDRKYTCEIAGVVAGKTQYFPSAEAQPNTAYTVRQLLELMTVNSDNRATQTLMQHMPIGRFIKVFSDLGLHAPAITDTHYAMNVRDVSIFMKALYNGSYLSPINSEYALEMLTRCEFKQGVVAGLPADISVAHKFGESGDPTEKQLHETALVYLNGHNYLITIMTRGQDIMKLPAAQNRPKGVEIKTSGDAEVMHRDFRALTSAFDAARTAAPGLSRWALADAVAGFDASVTDDGAAFGGDLAVAYAGGGFSGVNVARAFEILQSDDFAAAPQTLRDPAWLKSPLSRTL